MLVPVDWQSLPDWMRSIQRSIVYRIRWIPDSKSTQPTATIAMDLLCFPDDQVDASRSSREWFASVDLDAHSIPQELQPGGETLDDWLDRWEPHLDPKFERLIYLAPPSQIAAPWDWEGMLTQGKRSESSLRPAARLARSGVQMTTVSQPTPSTKEIINWVTSRKDMRTIAPSLDDTVWPAGIPPVFDHDRDEDSILVCRVDNEAPHADVFDSGADSPWVRGSELLGGMIERSPDVSFPAQPPSELRIVGQFRLMDGHAVVELSPGSKQALILEPHQIRQAIERSNHSGCSLYHDHSSSEDGAAVRTFADQLAQSIAVPIRFGFAFLDGESLIQTGAYRHLAITPPANLKREGLKGGDMFEKWLALEGTKGVVSSELPQEFDPSDLASIFGKPAPDIVEEGKKKILGDDKLKAWAEKFQIDPSLRKQFGIGGTDEMESN